MKETGGRIRIQRKKSGLTIAQLAQRIGVSPITLQRFETGKSSPSVILLSQIAQVLDKHIVTFLATPKRSFVHITGKSQRSILSHNLKIKMIGPRKMIADNIAVSYGEHKKGKTVEPHTNPGIEFAYILEGKLDFKHDNKSCILRPGDSIAYDARIEHSSTALETVKFFGIFMEDNLGA